MSLGIAHPPGYPLWTLLARGALWLPFGEPAFRVALLAAACGAVAVALVVGWIRRATGSVAAAVAAGGALATGATFWGQATIAEVYSFHALLLLALLVAAFRVGAAAEERERSWALFAGGVVLGAGLAHHPTIILALPSAIVLLWPGLRRLRARNVLVVAAVALAIPAVLYGTLLLRARLDPVANWGEPRTLAALAAHAAALQYRANDLGFAGLLRPEAWARLLGWAWRDGAGVALLLAAFGAWSRRDRIAASLLFLIAASFAFTARYAVEDVEAYLLPAAVSIAALAGLGVARLGRAGWGAVALAIAAPLLFHGRTLDRHRFTAAEEYGRDLLATVPRGGLLLFQGDDGFLPWYLRHAKGERPDVTLVDLDGNLGERLDIATAIAQGATRPVVVTNPPELAMPEGLELRPWGLFLRVARVGDPPLDDAAVWGAYHGASILEQSEAKEDFWGRTVAAWYPIARARRAPDRASLLRELDEAVRIAPDSEAVRNMAGALAAGSGDLSRAAREFEAATRLKPSSWRAWANLARARGLLGDRAGAEEALRKAHSLERR